MKKLITLLAILISAYANAQINAVNDTTRITASPTFSPQFVPNIFNSGGVNYRVTYVYNPSTQKYDAVVYSKYLRRFYIAKADSSSNYISPWQFNHGNNTIGGTWDFNKITANSITIDPAAFGGIVIQNDSIKTASPGTGIVISPQQYLSLSPRDGTIVTGNMFEKDSRWALNSGDAHFAVDPTGGVGGIYITNTGANAQLSFGGDGTKTPVTLTYGDVYPTTADGYLYIRGGSYGTTSLGHVISSNDLSRDSTYNAATYAKIGDTTGQGVAFIKNYRSITTPQSGSQTINGYNWNIDGTLDLSTWDSTTSPSVMDTRPRILIARSIKDTTVASHGFADDSKLTATSDGQAYAVFNDFVTFAGSSHYDHFLAFQNRFHFSGTGTLDFMQGYRDNPYITSGTVDQRYGVRISNPVVSGTGVLNKNYGIEFEAQTAGTVNFDIHAPSSTSKMLFGGNTYVNNLVFSNGAASPTLNVPATSTQTAPSFLTYNTSTGFVERSSKVTSTDATIGGQASTYTGNVQSIVATSLAWTSGTATNNIFATPGGTITIYNSATAASQFQFSRDGTSIGWRSNNSGWTSPIMLTGTAGQTYTFPAVSASLAPLANPTFTGTPAAPTPAPGTNTTQIQTAAGTIAERTATATLTGKTLTTPKLTGYTVATLPAGTIGMIAYVTDALTPTFGNILVGGGSVVAKAFYNGTNWINE